MIQAIEVIDMYDRRCLNVKFYYATKKADGDNLSHSMSYLHAREYFQREFGDIMGLENLETIISKREDLE